MSEQSGDGPIPEHDIDDLIHKINSEYELDPEVQAAYEEMGEELREKAELVIAQLQEIYPDLDLESYKAEVNKKWGPEHDGLLIEIETMIHQMPDPAVTTNEAILSAAKLKTATEMITRYAPELHLPLLRAIDIVIPAGQQMHQLSYDEIRFMNLAQNGGSVDREELYRSIRQHGRKVFRPLLELILEEKYGAHDDIGEGAYVMVEIGMQLALLEWERYHTDDAPESVREANYHNAKFVAELRLRYESENSIFNEAVMVECADLVRENVIQVLKQAREDNER